MENEKINRVCDLCQKGLVVKLVSIFVAVLILFFLAKTYGVLKENKFIGQDIEARNTITVNGESEVSAIPDIAKFSFSVKEEAKTVGEAQKLATEKMNKVLAFLKKSSVAEKNIKTAGYNIYPRYEWWNREAVCLGINCPPNQERRLVAYEVSQNISVRLEKIETAGEILAGIGALEVSNVSGLNFEIDDKDALERQARQDAITEAKEKAQQLARDLGVDLVRIVSFSTAGANVYPMYYGVEMTKSSGVGAVAVPEIPVGENEIKATVQISYEIK